MSNVLLLFARGAKWTALMPRDGERHFVVRGALRSRDVDGTRAPRPDRIVLEAVTTGRVREVAAAELADAARWLPDRRRGVDVGGVGAAPPLRVSEVHEAAALSWDARGC